MRDLVAVAVGAAVRTRLLVCRLCGGAREEEGRQCRSRVDLDECDEMSPVWQLRER